MIDICNTYIIGAKGAIRGMRNPLNSWGKSDSKVTRFLDEGTPYFMDDGYIIGENDLSLAKKLVKAGSDHRKFLRMIHVQADVLAPMYWWKEFDTYKVGTVANSCSTMHTIHKKEFTLDDFSHEHLNFIKCGSTFYPFAHYLQEYMDVLNFARKEYLKTKDKDLWWVMIQMLPSSYNQLRTIDLNYEVLLNIYHARKNHKLDEWHTFCEWIEKLPYMKDFLGLEDENEEEG